MNRDISSYGFGRGTLRRSGDWDARVGGNDQDGLGSTPGGRSPREVPPFGRGRFAPGACSTPMPQGEGASNNATQYGSGYMSLTRGAELDGSREAPGFKQFYSLLQERQTILEGVVDCFRGEMSQIQGNISQVQGDLDAVNNRVDSLGQDAGALRGDIGLLRTEMGSVGKNMGSMETNMGTQLSEITQMLAGKPRSDKTESDIKPQGDKVCGSEPVVTRSQAVRVPNPVSVDNPEITPVIAAQGQPLSSVSNLGSGLPRTITLDSFPSGDRLTGRYPVYPSMGPSVPNQVEGGMSLPVTLPNVALCSSAANVGSQSPGSYGGLLGQSTELGRGQSFVPGMGSWLGVPQGHTLMTTADTALFQSLIPQFKPEYSS